MRWEDIANGSSGSLNGDSLGSWDRMASQSMDGRERYAKGGSVGGGKSAFDRMREQADRDSGSCERDFCYAEGGSVEDHRDAQRLAGMGRDGDTELVHVNKDEEALLKAAGGRGSVNPKTGLREYPGNYEEEEEEALRSATEEAASFCGFIPGSKEEIYEKFAPKIKEIRGRYDQEYEKAGKKNPQDHGSCGIQSAASLFKNHQKSSNALKTDIMTEEQKYPNVHGYEIISHLANKNGDKSLNFVNPYNPTGMTEVMNVSRKLNHPVTQTRVTNGPDDSWLINQPQPIKKQYMNICALDAASKGQREQDYGLLREKLHKAYQDKSNPVTVRTSNRLYSNDPNAYGGHQFNIVNFHRKGFLERDNARGDAKFDSCVLDDPNESRPKKVHINDEGYIIPHSENPPVLRNKLIITGSPIDTYEL